MKLQKHIETANRIGADSWELLSFVNLPKNASSARQITALKQDREWQRLKYEETGDAIDRLIADIESSSNTKGEAPQ